MYKEIIIIIVIVITVLIGHFTTQNFTKKNVKLLTNELSILEENLKQQSYSKANEKIEVIQFKINEIHHKLSYYIEHDEIEKVETCFTACKSLIRTKDYNLAINEIEKTIFVLNHMTDKYSFSLDNIF